MKSRKIINRKITKKRKKGFTLLELIVVIIVLGVIAIVTVPIINDSLKEAREKMIEEQTSTIIEAAQKWNVERIANAEESNKVGSDMVIVLDTSYSMRQNNRSTKVMAAINDFVINFLNDNIYNRVALVTFAQYSRTILPLDHYSITGGSLFTQIYPHRFQLTSGVYNSDRTQMTSIIQFEAGTYTQLGLEAGFNGLLNSYSGNQIPTILLVTDGDPRHYTTSYTSVSTGTPIYTESPISSDQIVDVAYYTLMTANYYKKRFYNKTGEQLNFFTLSLELNEEDLKESLDSSYNFSDEDIRQYINTVINPNEANIDLLAEFGDNTLSNLLYKKLFNDSSIDKTNYSYVDYSYNMDNYTTEGLIESLDEMVELAGLTSYVSIDTLIAENYISGTGLTSSDGESLTGGVKIVFDPVKQKYVYSFYNDKE